MSELPWKTHSMCFRVSHSSNKFYSVVFIIFHVSHCNSLIYTDKNHTVEHISWVSYPENIFVGNGNCVYQWVKMRNMEKHWYTQFPFPKNVFFRVSHSSNMFCIVVFVIFHNTVEHIRWVSYHEKHILWKREFGISMSYNEKHGKW